MMTIEENKKLCELYPYLICRNVWTDQTPEDYDYSYIYGDYDIPNGWRKLFLQFCDDIRQPLINANYINEFRFIQIKEKFGEMRIYTSGAPEEVQDIISRYEHISRYVCCECGQPATQQSQGWICPYCDEHANNKHEQYKPIEFNPMLHIEGYKNGKDYEKFIDCSDIWRRLYNDQI